MHNRKHEVLHVQGHPRSLILAPIERAYATSYWWLIVTLVLSCTIFEIWRLIGWKLWIFPTPLSFNALAQGEPFRISGWFFTLKTRVLGLSVGEVFVILACIVFTQCQHVTYRETDGRHPDDSLYTACIAEVTNLKLKSNYCRARWLLNTKLCKLERWKNAYQFNVNLSYGCITSRQQKVARNVHTVNVGKHFLDSSGRYGDCAHLSMHSISVLSTSVMYLHVGKKKPAICCGFFLLFVSTVWQC